MPCAAARREVAKACAGEVRVGEEEEGGPGPLKERERTESGDEGEEKGGAEEAGGRSVEGQRWEGGFGSPSSGGAADGGGGSGGCGDAGPDQPAEGQPRRAVTGVGGGIGGAGGGGSGEGGGETGCWWDTVRARLVRGGGFTECAAADVLARLEWAAEQEEDEGDGDPLEDGPPAVVSAAATGNDGTRDGVGRRRRMLRHLEATSALCEEWRLLAGGGTASRRTRSRGGGGGGSWSGWEAFGLAVATSASRDRLSLCCWAVRPLMGGDAAADGAGRHSGAPACPGLPRGEVIELLCLMLCALRSLDSGDRGGGGSVRLKADLLVCARVLENWDVR